MRNNPKLRKALTLILCAVALVAISVGATIAYLTDTQSVTNTFTVGQVHIKLDETKTDINGVTTNEGRTEAGNKYKLMPGHTYTKDPMVTVAANSEDCYVRMKVTVNNIEDLKKIFPKYVDSSNGLFLVEKLVQGWDRNVWTVASATPDNAGDTCTYEFRYANKVSKSNSVTELPELFTSFKIPENVTNDEILALRQGYKFGEVLNKEVTDTTGEYAEFAIDVVAHAMQADGFNSAEAAWIAFDTPTT